MPTDDGENTIGADLSEMHRTALTEALQAYLAEQDARVGEALDLHDVPETIWHSDRAQAARALMERFGIEPLTPIDWRTKYVSR